MSRKNQKSNDRRKQLQRRRQRTALGSLHRQLSEIDELWEAGELDEAEYEKRLEALGVRFPRQSETLLRLIAHYQSQADFGGLEKVCRRLVEIQSDQPDYWLMLAGACMANLRPALVLQAVEHVLAAWPDHEQAVELRKTAVETRELIDREFKAIEPDAARRRELALLHDQIRAALDEGELQRTVELSDFLLQRWPIFTPAQNNLCEAHFRQGHVDLAVSHAQQVLELDPKNYHALGNLARYQLLSGRIAEASATAERLKQVRDPSSIDLPVKKAETLAFLGDWQGVLDAFDGAAATTLPGDHGNSMLLHFAAVAALNLGREQEARANWKAALEFFPGLHLATENLEDLDSPIGQRNGPWAFTINYWLPKSTFNRLLACTKEGLRQRNDTALERESQKFLAAHPEVLRLAPLLLERGDWNSRTFVIQLAQLANSPELFAALREFAFGRRGADALRRHAVLALTEAGQIDPGIVTVWIDGQQQEVLSAPFEITSKPTGKCSKQIEPLLSGALEAMRDLDGGRAEQHLRRALRLERDDPVLLFNLSQACELQGRSAEAAELVRQVHERHPHYLFGRVGMAKYAADERRYDDARRLLMPILRQKRFHLTEFGALANGFVHLFWMEGRRAPAKAWLAMWKNVARNFGEQNDPRIESWDRRLNRGGLLGKLFG